MMRPPEHQVAGHLSLLEGNKSPSLSPTSKRKAKQSAAKGEERKPFTPRPAIPLPPSPVPERSLSLSLSAPCPSPSPSPISPSEMVLRSSEIDKAQKPPPVAATAGPSFSVPFKNPTLWWGRTRRMLFQPVSGRRGPNDRHPPPLASQHQTKNDPSPSCGRFSVFFKNPTLRWGSTACRMCCLMVSGHRDPTDRRPSSASLSPPSTSHQTKNDPNPHPGRPRLVIRIPCRTQAKVPDINRPPAPERRDHCQETREAATGGAPLKIARPIAGPVTRSFRSGAGVVKVKKILRRR